MISIEKDILLEIYRKMLTIRMFEEKVVDMYNKGQIGGPLHLCVGQEAPAATVGTMLRKEDYISSNHRGHGHVIGKGARLDLTLAELLGKTTGYCKGRGGTMHISDLDDGIIGTNGIVGGGIPVAVGAALSAKMQKKDVVSVTFFGESASNEGIFHESLNMAAVWRLPVIFVCENNGYGISVTQKVSTAVENIADRAASYSFPGVTIDGNDVFAIYEAMCGAIKRARDGEGPTLVECKTYRWRGHWEGDPQVSRTKEQLDEWMKKCPIKRLRKYLLEEMKMMDQEIIKIESDVREEIEKAAIFALESPYPDPGSLMDDLFAEHDSILETR
ncbi:MAG: thiamine pyrophosphate-dependent dehydrogenase E1 component subunit alpha [Clostridiales bacterium]|nr:thiamine pyrophosphate-dependent dehydrogenase E1 component subunit alpha [Clostridiales bacterium]